MKVAVMGAEYERATKRYTGICEDSSAVLRIFVVVELYVSM